MFNKLNQVKIICILFIIVLLISFINSGLLSHLKNICIDALTEIQQLDTIKSLFYFSLIFIIGNIFCLPIGLPLNLFAGMLWGTILGGIIVNILTVVVASLTFFIAGYFKQYLLMKWLSPRLLNKFKQYNCGDWQFIFAARINPIIPFSLSNYLFGFLPDLNFKRYVFITLFANLLPCFAIASIGSALKMFTDLDTNASFLLSQIMCVFLLLSTLFLIKWFFSKKVYHTYKMEDL